MNQPITVPCGKPQHPNGRQGVGVVQPQSGTRYPLNDPSNDIKELLADCYLSFDDPGLYDVAATPEYSLPLRVLWLAGFGCADPDLTNGPSTGSSSSTSVSSSTSASGSAGLPVWTNSADIILVDAANTIVVDTTADDVEYSGRAWGSRLWIHSWLAASWTLTIVQHTHWLDSESREYPCYFFPEFAEIVPRCTVRRERRVRTIRVAGNEATIAPTVFLDAGYNTSLSTLSNIQGVRSQTLITIDSEAGGGLGTFPDCNPKPINITHIGGQPGDEYGNFNLDFSGCYFIRRPLVATSTDPLVFVPTTVTGEDAVYDPELPDPAAGTAKDVPGWPIDDMPDHALLVIGNNCEPCCDCDDYVDVAEYMYSVADRWEAIGESIEATRTLYHKYRDDWIKAKACYDRYPLRLKLQAQNCPYLDVLMQYCNTTTDCLHDVTLTVEFSGGTATPVTGFGQLSGGSARKPGRRAGGAESWDVNGAFPKFSATLPVVTPGSTGWARFRLKFDDCGVTPSLQASDGSSVSGGASPLQGEVVYARLTGTVGSEPITILPIYGPETEAEAISQVVLRCPGDPNTLYDPLECLCPDDETTGTPSSSQSNSSSV